MPRTRKHHNNKGYAQVRSGKTEGQVRGIAQRLKVPYGKDHLMPCGHSWGFNTNGGSRPCFSCQYPDNLYAEVAHPFGVAGK